MGTFKVTGFDKLEKRLKKLSKNAQALDGKHDVPFSELFSSKFMRTHSSFSSFNELLVAGGFEVNSQDDFDAIPEDAFDQHVAAVTDFDSWEDMQSSAVKEYITRRLFAD